MKIEFSKKDIERNVKIPSLRDANLAEETGIHIGDGSMNIYNNRYLFSLRGHRMDDEIYYKKFVTALYKKVYGIDIHIRYWPDVIGFQLSSKAMLTFKHNVLGLPLGSKENIQIPKFLIKSKRLILNCIRGIFDTDGCFSFERKSKEAPYYPKILISTTSPKLKNQLVNILHNTFKFNLSVWVESRNYKNWKDIYRICIRGEKNIIKWFKLIGSNNPKNIFKYEYWRKYGYAPVAQR